jgi:hypothetical protein
MPIGIYMPICPPLLERGGGQAEVAEEEAEKVVLGRRSWRGQRSGRESSASPFLTGQLSSRW